jgi:hypothetical protein
MRSDVVNFLVQHWPDIWDVVYQKEKEYIEQHEGFSEDDLHDLRKKEVYSILKKHFTLLPVQDIIDIVPEETLDRLLVKLNNTIIN